MGEKFRRKYWFVADWHKNETPAEMTYSSVVSSDSFQITLTTTAINDLEILEYDIQNAYLTEELRELVCIIAVTEFGSEDSHCMILKKAL